MEREIAPLFMKVMIEVIDTVGVEQRGPPLDAVHAIAFGEQQLRKVGAVLARNSGDKGIFLRHSSFSPELHNRLHFGTQGNIYRRLYLLKVASTSNALLYMETVILYRSY